MIKINELIAFKENRNFFVVVEPEDHKEFLQLCKDAGLKEWENDRIIDPDAIHGRLIQNELRTKINHKHLFIEIENQKYISYMNVNEKLNSMPYYNFSELKGSNVLRHYHDEIIDENKNEK